MDEIQSFFLFRSARQSPPSERNPDTSYFSNIPKGQNAGRDAGGAKAQSHGHQEPSTSSDPFADANASAAGKLPTGAKAFKAPPIPESLARAARDFEAKNNDQPTKQQSVSPALHSNQLPLEGPSSPMSPGENSTKDGKSDLPAAFDDLDDRLRFLEEDSLDRMAAKLDEQMQNILHREKRTFRERPSSVEIDTEPKAASDTPDRDLSVTQLVEKYTRLADKSYRKDD